MRTQLSSVPSIHREMIRFIWAESSTFVKVRLLWVLGLVIVVSNLAALAPVALKLIVDRLTGKPAGSVASVPVLIAIYVLIQWTTRFAGEIRGLVYSVAERRMFRTISERLFAHLMKLPARFHLDRHTGAVNQTLENGLQGYQSVVQQLVFTSLPVTVELGTIVLVIALTNHPVFLALFCGALFCYMLTFFYATTANANAAKEASARHIDASAAMTDGILNYETVKYFAAEAVIQEKVEQALRRTEIEWVRFFRRYALTGLGMAMTFAIFLGLTISFSAYEVQHNRMTLGDFVLVNTYMLQIVRPVEALGYAIQGLSRGVAMAEKMLALFHERPESPIADDLTCVGVDAKDTTSEVEFRSVSFSFSRDRLALHDVSFCIPAGRTLGIVGPSGSGKSTIVRILLRFFEPQAGGVLLDNLPISGISLRTLRQRIAVVPQDCVLFNDTIGYNIGFGKENATRGEIERAAKRAQIHEFIVSLPDKYDTLVGERGVKLAGGERQRIAIARAVIKQPAIFVFDEATSSLDSNTEQEILKNIQDISRSTTTLIIAHRLSTVLHADEIIVLNEGTIVERGTFASLISLNGYFSALWAAQHSRPSLEA
jgi:ABC-type transport system involved in Fe-S cluster assembly fused permease/ATPase subunit